MSEEYDDRGVCEHGNPLENNCHRCDALQPSQPKPEDFIDWEDAAIGWKKNYEALRAEVDDLKHQRALSYAALGDVNEHVYVFDHIHKLRASHKQLVEALRDRNRIACIWACADEVITTHSAECAQVANLLEAAKKLME